MDVNFRTSGYFSKSLLKLAACAFLATGTNINPILAAPGVQEKTTAEIVQQKTVLITGQVVDKNGDGLPGVNVLEQGTTNGTVTDLDGNYRLNVKGSKSVLVFSYVGYIAQNHLVGNNKAIKVTLKEDSKLVEEVVVIGYGTQRKGDVTSSVASVKAENFTIGNIGDAAELVKGKIAGLSITKSSGDPNAESSILLRGINTLSGSVTPLVLIDGIPGGLGTVPPENIASIDVLKDASAAAIYGTRGANGVILITTKSGKRDEKTHVAYSAYASAANFYKEAEFMSAQDIRDGKTAFSDKGYDTDWVKAVTRTGFTQNHNINLSGGTKTTSYSADVSYRDSKGVIKRTDNQELKMSFDISHWMLNDMVKVNFNLVKGIHKNSANNASDAGIANIYRQAVIHNPTAPIYYLDGSYYEDFNVFQYYNPVSMLEELKGNNKSELTRMTGNVTIEPIKGWQTNLMVSTRSSFDATSTYQTSNYFSCLTSGETGSAYKASGNSRTDQLELTSKYNKIFGQHRLDALVGYSYQSSNNEGFSASNYDFPTDFYSYNNLYLGAALKDGHAYMGSSQSESTLIGFFGRLSYGYANKYNVLLSLRHEGSSKFGVDNKWGTFPSASVGWTISNEKFMKNIDVINTLKLRAGYGVTGVEPSESYKSLNKYGFGQSYYYRNGVWTAGLEATANANPNLKWEKSAEFNVGLDWSILDERLSGSIDYYNKKTTDLLWDYRVPMPPNEYQYTTANVGQMRNSGVEVVINAIPFKSKNFQWNTTITASHNENKLLSLSNDLYETENYMNTGYLGDPISVPTHRLEVGKSMGNYWGLKSVGISDKGLWMIENPATGEAEEFTANMLNDKYRQYLGNGLPKLNMGWNNTFKYKNWDLSMQMNGQFGFKILNEQRCFYENNSIAYNRLKSASDLVYGKRTLSSAQSQTFVSYYLEKGDYMKMTNMTLGYTFNVEKIKNYVSNLRIYLSAENLFCITGYKGLDPELGNSDLFSAGNDFRDKYPTLRSFTFGVNISF